MYIGSDEIRTGKKLKLAPHDHQFVLGYFHEGDASHVHDAIEALEVREAWANLSWEYRARYSSRRQI